MLGNFECVIDSFIIICQATLEESALPRLQTELALILFSLLHDGGPRHRCEGTLLIQNFFFYYELILIWGIL
jgi:hypothetical protein